MSLVKAAMKLTIKRLEIERANHAASTTGLTWTVVGVVGQSIAVVTAAVVAVIRINTHVRTFSVVELTFVHRLARRVTRCKERALPSRMLAWLCKNEIHRILQAAKGLFIATQLNSTQLGVELSTRSQREQLSPINKRSDPVDSVCRS